MDPGLNKVDLVLRTLGVEDLEKASRTDIIVFLGKLLSLKARGRSVHEVTKEVRRALELAVHSPLNIDIDTVVRTNPPFKSRVLNDAYRKLLKRLLETMVPEAAELTPLWRRKLVNIVVENIYSVATSYETNTERKRFREEIRNILKRKE